MSTTVSAPKLSMAECSALFAEAHEAGMRAGKEIIPEPMYVVGVSPTGEKTYYPPVMDGMCGFAWVTVRPGNSAFARYLKSRGCWKGTYGGVDLWVHEFNQSVTRKEAYAEAFAKVLREAGIDAYASSRLD